jgi:hypothetical protein
MHAPAPCKTPKPFMLFQPRDVPELGSADQAPVHPVELVTRQWKRAAGSGQRREYLPFLPDAARSGSDTQCVRHMGREALPILADSVYARADSSHVRFLDLGYKRLASRSTSHGS